MKKTIYILLVFLCVFTLASCSKLKKSDAVSKKDLLDFLKDKGLYSITDSEYDYKLANAKYEYEFTVRSYEKEEWQKGYLSKKINLKGRAVLEIKNETSYLEYYMKGKGTYVEKEPTISNKLSAKSKVKEEIYRIITSDSTRLYYIDQEIKYRTPYENYKKDVQFKTTNNKSEFGDEVPNFASIIGYPFDMDVYGFIDGKKCTFIYSNISLKKTFEMWFDGDEITKLKITSEYYDGKDVTVLKFKDVGSIEKPKNSSNYEDVEKNNSI